MLNTTDLVKVADTVNKDKVKYFTTFDRPYLSYAEGDETTTESVELDTVDNGKQTVSVTSPKNSDSKTDSATLLQQAIAYFQADQEKNVSDASKRKDPVLLLLKAADNGLVASLRMEVRNKLVPKTIDVDKAVVKMAQALMQRKPDKYSTLEAAIKAVQDTLL